jgi:hypothetical protein
VQFALSEQKLPPKVSEFPLNLKVDREFSDVELCFSSAAIRPPASASFVALKSIEERNSESSEKQNFSHNCAVKCIFVIPDPISFAMRRETSGKLREKLEIEFGKENS